MKKIEFDGNKNVIYKNVKLFRVKRDLTQSQLAAKLQTMNINIDQQMISRIENNSRFVTDYELACLCLILNVDVKDMLQDFYDGLDKD
ncbi:helix-turn-helix domain-containing protein [Acetivibrio sp. MSJd-27]|jgi:hypothetical protein|uniref:helix-turn-helix domain-containing protein n=1 Tax=Acetivibrio sp. MSJd-27 TaxID=2841523 RepID=UPI001C10620A|nr:helix-turn-helix transcriptional regulator [Acetivibrio sp. MSJd-27]MBU5449255.1 helix-turn-helix domain-containing protein [Acetivibrio sp. MSJd-27]